MPPYICKAEAFSCGQLCFSSARHVISKEHRSRIIHSKHLVQKSSLLDMLRKGVRQTPCFCQCGYEPELHTEANLNSSIEEEDDA
jgi:hypothetical protein